MTESVEVKFCPQCGSSVVGMRFCGQCGYAARPAAVTAPPDHGPVSPASPPIPQPTTQIPQPQAPAPQPQQVQTPPAAAAGHPVPPTYSPVVTGPDPVAGGQPGWAAPAGAPPVTTLGWPIPERVVDVSGRKVVLEIAVSAAVLIALGVFFGIASRDALSVLQYVGDLPAQLVLSTLALTITWAFVVFAMIWTGWQLIKTNPVARPLMVVWTVFTAVVAIAGSGPWWAWLIAVILGACSAALYVSPWAKKAFADAESAAARPTPIEFSLVLSKVLFGVTALNGVALLPTLSSVSDMNAMGEWTGDGAIGTKLAFGVILLLVTVALGFMAIGKVSGRDVSGRMILLGIGVVSLLSSWLVFGSGTTSSLGLGSNGVVIGSLVTWSAILIPLWLGSAPAEWFRTRELTLSLGVDPKA